jgi:hypothetical protein
VSLTILHFAAKSEVVILLVAAAVSLIAFLISLAQGAPKPVLIMFGALSAVFAGPWVLTFIGSIVASMMPMGMNLEDAIGGYAGKVADVPIGAVKRFRAQPFQRRITAAYLWAFVNAIPAIAVAVIGLVVIYAFANMK